MFHLASTKTFFQLSFLPLKKGPKWHRKRDGAGPWFNLFIYCPTFTLSSENKTRAFNLHLKTEQLHEEVKMAPVFAFRLPWFILITPAVTGCTNATHGGEQAAAFKLIRNNSWLANEEETACQEVPWTSRETLFQSPGQKKKINADASSRKRLGD